MQEVVTANHLKRYLLLDNEGEIIIPVAKFLKYKDNSGSARNTLRSYTFRLKLYFDFLSRRNLHFGRVGVDEIADFVQWLRSPEDPIHAIPMSSSSHQRASRTINQVLDAVMSFYDYLLMHKEYATNLSETLKTQLRGSKRGYKDFLYHVNKNRLYDVKKIKLKEPKHAPKVLTAREVQTVLEKCTNSRDTFLIYLLYETGMRIGEALSLKREDMRFGERQVNIRNRGEIENEAAIKTPSSARTLDVTPTLMNLYDEYFFEYLDADDVETDFVFIQLSGLRKNRPLKYQTVNSLVKRLREKTGIHFTAHVLRHTCLTELWRTKKMRPEILRLRAGHQQIQTTLQMYVHPSHEDIAAEWEAAMNAKTPIKPRQGR